MDAEKSVAPLLLEQQLHKFALEAVVDSEF